MQRLARNEIRVGAVALVVTIATVVGLVATSDPSPPHPSTHIGSNHIQPTGDTP